MGSRPLSLVCPAQEPEHRRQTTMEHKVVLISLFTLGIVEAYFFPQHQFVDYKFPAPMPKIFVGQKLKPDLGKGLPIFKDTFKPLSSPAEVRPDTFVAVSKQYQDTFLPVYSLRKDKKQAFVRGKKDGKRFDSRRKGSLIVVSVP